MGIDVNEQGAVEYLRRYARTVSKDRAERVKVLAAGAQKVKHTAAKPPTPKSEKPHYYYAKAGKIEIKPGNLRKSMKVYRTKGGDVEVGPRVIKKVSGIYATLGQTAATSSGFYAAALYGSASAFRQAVMEPALSRAQSQALAAMQKRYEKLHQKLTR